MLRRLAATVAATGRQPPAWLPEAAGDPWELPGGIPEPYALGIAYERALGDEWRRGSGAFFTPPWLCERVVELVVESLHGGALIDPACGAGAFLLAAIDRMVDLGASPEEALARVRGSDVDPTTVEVARTCLWLWAAERGLDASTAAAVDLRALDALVELPEGWRGTNAAVVGNPPFLDQLDATSARDGTRTDALRRRFGDAVRPYTDDAALFLLAAAELAEPGGAVALVQPRSVLASRDAAGVRERLDRVGSLVEVWLDDRAVFEGAEIRVCVPVIHLGEPGDPFRWSALAATAAGVPVVELASHLTVGDVASVVAGFRDEYYALADAVSEADDVADRPRLVTSGAIDLADLRWGRDPVRFAKRRWQRPVVDVDAVDGPRGDWWRTRLVPKVLVATQTSVIEAVVDPDGALVPSVPVLSLEPVSDETSLWHLAAAVSAPPVVAWLARRCIGTALSVGALKVAAPDLRDVPLPPDRSAWDEGADAFGRAQRSTDLDERAEALAVFGVAMTRAYGARDEVRIWWSGRLRLR